MIEVQDREVRRRADVLVHEGKLREAVLVLVDHHLIADAVPLLETQTPRLNAAARYDDVIAAMEPLPEAHWSLFLRVSHLDARRHTSGISSSEIQQLIDEAQTSGQPVLKSWACATLAEHLLLQGDLTCVVLAARYLAEMPDDPMPPVLLLQARGRLRRILALAFLASGPENEHQAQEELQRAVSDFRRAGWHTERWISISLFYLFYVAVSWSAPPQVAHALIEARDQLLALNSSQVHFARYVVAFAGYSNGDLATIHREYTALIELAPRGEPEALPVFAGCLEAVCEAVLRGRPVALERLTAADQIRRIAPSMIGAVLVKAAHALLDLGLPDQAQVWFGRLNATAAVLPYEQNEREVIAARLALVRGDTSAAPRLVAAVDQVAAGSYPRVTAGLTLRAAMDAARAGLPELAVELRLRAETVLPPEAERNDWERYWYANAGAARPVTLPDSQAPTDQIDPDTAPVESAEVAQTSAVTRSPAGVDTGRVLRLLAPSVEVVVDGSVVRLAPNVARLLVSLAALGRAVGTEELGDLLWGDVDPARARGRLKSALHRLRQALSLGPDELVLRQGDVVRLVPDPRWTIDLHDFHRFAAGDSQQRLRAFRMVHGMLCSAQFPYDDVLADERAVIQTRWLSLATSLVAAGQLDEHEVQRRAQRLGVALPSL